MSQRKLDYGWGTSLQHQVIDWPLVAAASVSAFTGAFFGSRAPKKLTIRGVRVLVSALLVLVSLGLITGAM